MANSGGSGSEMYTCQREIAAVTGSVSPFHNNLTLFRTENKSVTYAAFAPIKHQVNTISWDTKIEGMTTDTIVTRDPSGSSSSSRTFMVLQVKYCHIPGRNHPFLVVCTTGGVMIYEWNASSLLSFYPIHRSELDDQFCYTKGIATLDHYICVGSHNGSIIVFSGRESAVKQKSVMKEHKAPIGDIGSDCLTLMASVSGDGTVLCWERADPSGLKILSKISTGHSIGLITTHQGYVFCGTILGQILVYQGSSGEQVLEIAAHARTLTSLSFAQEAGLLLSTSEDSFLRVWKCKVKPKESDPCEISCAFSHNVENVSLVGGAFVDDKGGSFCATGFDHPTIFYFKYNKLSRSKSVDVRAF